MITRNRQSSIASRVVAAVVFAAGAALLSTAVAPRSAGATTLRRLASGSAPSTASTDGAATSTMEVGYFDISSPYSDNGSGNGDNLLRLINPTDADGTLCAEIYVFDSEEEMGECCGCPITPNGLDQISVGKDLLTNWFLPGGPPPSGTIVELTTTEAFGCDPTVPVTEGQSASNIIGYITHNQVIDRIPATSSLTEVPLYDQGAPDSAEAAYLSGTCGFLLGDGTGLGYCSCGFSSSPLG